MIQELLNFMRLLLEGFKPKENLYIKACLKQDYNIDSFNFMNGIF